MATWQWRPCEGRRLLLCRLSIVCVQSTCTVLPICCHDDCNACPCELGIDWSETVVVVYFLHQVFNDPVHGHITLHPACVAIVDTPQFQRLRDIKQLGGGYFVYSGASHNRFEHSIGVCHLAGKLVRALKERQPELNIEEKDVLCVEIAGLCHDMGHGPYSHVFNTMFIPRARRDQRLWKYENASLAMFDQMISKNPSLKNKLLHVYKLEEKDLNFIKNLICPPSQDDEQKTFDDGRDNKKSFLYEIVANKQSEIDVDKWDYLLRDCLHLGMRSNFDHDRFICFARVIEVLGKYRICVRDKEEFSVYQLFQTRHSLYKKAYRHRVCNAVESMFVEILMLAEQVPLIRGKSGELKTASQCIDDMTAFTNLTDYIFHQIRISTDVGLKKARDLLQALDERRLFCCVGESRPIAKSKCEILNEDNPLVLDKEEKVKKSLTKLMEELKFSHIPDERILVQVVTLDFGKKNLNPLANLYFYTKHNVNCAQLVNPEEVSHLVPKEQFQEQVVRVYLKHYWDEEEKLVVDHKKDAGFVGEAFKLWCEKNELEKPKLFFQTCQVSFQEEV